MKKTPDIKGWIESLPGVQHTRQGILIINGKQYEAIDYVREFTTPEGSRYPGKYIRNFIYVLGWVSDLKGKGNKTAFIIDGIDGYAEEWYVASYSPSPILPEFSPFGPNFQLAPWNCGGRIDDGIEPKYKRIKASFVQY